MAEKLLWNEPLAEKEAQRLSIFISGLVQGVGFRPFVYRLAAELGLKGWVNNSSRGVTIEAEGGQEQLEAFLARINQEKPPRSSIHSFKYFFLEKKGYTDFEIKNSDSSQEKSTPVLPDMAACPDCLREIFDAGDRRYLYPFTNCTNCGPRFTIIESLPYDRGNTTMKKFKLCPKCEREYRDPFNRRFQAQANACPDCGPHFELWDEKGNVLDSRHSAIVKAVEAIQKGKIVAIKGLGGFHLAVDARNEKAVRRLRNRKHREEKPLALMFPTFESVEAQCDISELEKQLLLSFESPIVLLRRKKTSKENQTAPSVAPGNPYLGVMLPYTPLHHILMREIGFPIVATSGNLSDEPICIDECEALKRLSGIADLFLVHNRGIIRHMDDSVVRIVMNRPLVMRRARGYAPLPIAISPLKPGILAVGGHLKNTIALSVQDNIFVSQHIGDLETEQSSMAFSQAVKTLQQLYESPIAQIACDMHPEYFSTRYARKFAELHVTPVQHHHAHIVSCMAENHVTKSALGISWDGTGYGTDGTIWGGEFLLSSLSSFKRAGHFRTFRLPGGETAVREPRRAAIGVLYEIFKDKVFEMTELLSIRSFSGHERAVLKKMMAQRLNTPVTSSAGRLFDAVASLIGLYQKISFEGQAAMGLEFILDGIHTEEQYRFSIDDCSSVLIVDWEPMVMEIISDLNANVSQGRIAAKFHNTLAEMIVRMACKLGEKHVCLSGGCFQNKYLSERAILRLRQEGFKPIWHKDIPPNDGGIALGQVVVASYNAGKLLNYTIRT